MSVQKEWNQFEAAILLDNYTKHINGEFSRKEAIQKTSLELRTVAQRLGYKIDDIYRNINGITFQMHSMESAYKGYTLLKPASKLFTEIVQIYKHDNGRFIKILKEARRMFMTEESHSNNDHNLNEIGKKCIIDFSNIVDLSYTKPTKAVYFEDDLGKVSSWKELYVKVFQNLYEDYDYKIPKNKPFSLENGRMDFCTQEYYSSMVAPKEIERGFYLETNLSATDIVRKIKLLLDICLIDEENIVIEFERNDNKQPEIKTANRSRNNPNSDDFFDWLKNEQCMALPSCRSYVSAVKTAERFAMDNGFVHTKLFTDDFKQSQATIDELFNNNVFVKYNDQQHNRFKSALNKLLMYIRDKSDTASGEKNCIYLEPYTNILIEKFPRGYRIGSPLELKKFKRYWENLYGTGIDIEDDDIIKYIEHCGVKYEGKIYMPQKMLDDNIKIKLFSYINNCFLTEKTTIYFEALFKEFSNDFLDCYMYNANMLRAYLDYMNDGSYYISKNYISKDANVTTNPYDEIKDCLIQQGAPMEYSELFSILSNIPEQKIKTILAVNSEFISNGRGEYFHESIASLSDDELDDISDIIQYSIDEKRFISGNELIESIKVKYPYIVEQNVLLSENGLRGAIGYRLKERFSFKGNIISSLGTELSMTEVFEDFCKNRDSFTLDELKKLKQELATIIYFEVVYENSLRIGKNDFVSKKYAVFKTEETDAAIDRICVGDYIAIKKVEQFGLFPDAGFSWNSFLLEHYVAKYSPNYKLVHANYNESACVGGIVKKLSHIDTFDELVVDVLARNGLPLQKEIALQYLCDEGYLARRSYSDIEHTLIKAKELRNQKGL